MMHLAGHTCIAHIHPAFEASRAAYAQMGNTEPRPLDPTRSHRSDLIGKDGEDTGKNTDATPYGNAEGYELRSMVGLKSTSAEQHVLKDEAGQHAVEDIEKQAATETKHAAERNFLDREGWAKVKKAVEDNIAKTEAAETKEVELEVSKEECAEKQQEQGVESPWQTPELTYGN